MQKVNFSLLPLPSLQRTATVDVDMPENRRHVGVLLILSITAASGTGGLTVKVKGKDPVSGNFFDVLADGAAITATGTYAFSIAPGDGAAAAGVRVAVSRRLPQVWRVEVAHGDASNYTYSVTATMLA